MISQIGDTALHHAAANGHQDVVRLLTKSYGLSLEMKNRVRIPLNFRVLKSCHLFIAYLSEREISRTAACQVASKIKHPVERLLNEVSAFDYESIHASW